MSKSQESARRTERKIIQEVKEWPELYFTKNEDHPTWKEVAEACNLDAGKCYKVWANIRAQHDLHRKVLNKEHSSGSGKSKQSTPVSPHFEALYFLREGSPKRGTRSSSACAQSGSKDGTDSSLFKMPELPCLDPVNIQAGKDQKKGAGGRKRTASETGADRLKECCAVLLEKLQTTSSSSKSKSLDMDIAQRWGMLIDSITDEHIELKLEWRGKLLKMHNELEKKIVNLKNT